MRALQLQALEGPAGFAVVDLPAPADDEWVTIDVHAAGVSFPDLLMSRGRYQLRPDLPAVLGSEVAGTVRSAPPGHPLGPGDRVWATMELGGFAEVVAAPPDQVFPLPNDLSFEEGASLGVNFLTAVFALGRRGALRAGETVLVLGAAGGLGTATIGVAKTLGARVVAVVSTPEKAATAEAAGADEVVVGKDWRDAVLEHTDGRGAELVADVVGGAATLQAVRAAAPEGRVLVLGFTSGEIPSIATNRLLLRNVSLIGVGLGALTTTLPDLLAETVAELRRLLERGLRPVVGGTVPLERGADAVRRLEDRTAQGKIVLTVG
ncbi:MAG: NADPH:quinone oxidoreductase family protein [Actinobacteria bacterium]|nr:MAG: NADPH:quinone oxidoreductase family protein [Actinomycetota bacterium]